MVVRTLPRRSVPLRWFLRSLLILLVTLAAVLIIGWKTTLSYLGNYLVSPQSPQSADLILILGGDFWGPRVVKGADLAMQSYAPLVLFSGVSYQGRSGRRCGHRFRHRARLSKEVVSEL